MILHLLRRSLQEALDSWAREQGIIEPGPLVLNLPPPHVEADVSLPYPMQAAKALKRRPLDVAGELAGPLKGLRLEEPGGPDIPLLDASEAAAPGFLNLRLSREALAWDLAQIGGDPPYCSAPDAPSR
ncbi:MAG: hypothetical protein WCI75_20740, partial [candidate division NC10 bacterium]